MKIKNLIIGIFFIISYNAFPDTKENELAVHLLSYLAQDYGSAVHNGKILSKEEYQEQLDFSNEVVRIMNDNGYDNVLKKDILSLNSNILMKKDALVVSNLAKKIKTEIISRFNLLTYPKTAINLVRAKQLYQNNCMNCHGQNGYGDGKTGIGLEPLPANFHDLNRMQNVSPLGAYNTITYGVNGTGMAPHNYLSEEDRWSLAYYISSFRFQNIKKVEGVSLNIKDSSSLSDNEIKDKYGIDDKKFLGVLATIRDNNSNPPNDGQKNQVEIYVTQAINDLKESLNLYSSGKINEAKNIALTAYLQGIEPVEGIIRSSNKDLVPEIETALSKYRSLLNNKASLDELASVLNPVISKLENFIQSKEYSKTNSSSFLISFGIVVREAFEAGLILFLLLSLTKKSNAKYFNRYIHLGWISSLFIGIVLYFILDNYITITGKLAESLSGYTALIASALLFYVGYWMHKNADFRKLTESFASAVDNSLKSGQGIPLFLIVFASVFREMFEILLFLKILILDGHSKLFVGAGAILAIMLTFIVITTTLRYSIKLNLKYLFKASSVLILFLSITFLGQGIGALQKTGILEQTPLNVFSFSALGFNSTLEVLIAQLTIAALIFVYTLFIYKKKQSEKFKYISSLEKN